MRFQVQLHSVRVRTSVETRSISAGLVAGALLFVLVALPANGQGMAPTSDISVVLAPGATLELDGDSSLHRYSAKAVGMQAVVGIDRARVATIAEGSDLEALIRAHFIRTFHLTVPVDQLSSGEKGLDANMRKALKGNQYKDIRFQMDSYDVLASPVGGGGISLVLHGRLSLAGVEQKIDVGATGARVKEGFRVSGSKDLLMTDYQIKPPTMMLGAIKTKNLITVKFNVILQKETKT